MHDPARPLRGHEEPVAQALTRGRRPVVERVAPGFPGGEQPVRHHAEGVCREHGLDEPLPVQLERSRAWAASGILVVALDELRQGDGGLGRVQDAPVGLLPVLVHEPESAVGRLQVDEHGDDGSHFRLGHDAHRVQAQRGKQAPGQDGCPPVKRVPLPALHERPALQRRLPAQRREGGVVGMEVGRRVKQDGRVHVLGDGIVLDPDPSFVAARVPVVRPHGCPSCPRSSPRGSPATTPSQAKVRGQRLLPRPRRTCPLAGSCIFRIQRRPHEASASRSSSCGLSRHALREKPCRVRSSKRPRMGMGVVTIHLRRSPASCQPPAASTGAPVSDRMPSSRWQGPRSPSSKSPHRLPCT